MARLDGGHTAAGPSLLETLWEELDNVMDRLMSDEVPPSDVPPKPSVQNKMPLAAWRDEWMGYGETRGNAQGIAYAIAVIEQPYEPNVPGVKVRAMERWEERNDEEE